MTLGSGPEHSALPCLTTSAAAARPLRAGPLTLSRHVCVWGPEVGWCAFSLNVWLFI